jgi:drug/metabolite transporter (DMT)-like permease
MTPARYRLGLLLVTASAIAWSTTGLFTRAMPLDGATMLVWRGVYGALGMIALGLLLEGPGFLRGFAAFARRDGWPAWAFSAFGVSGMCFYITALKATSVAHVAVIYAAVPFVAAAIGWIFIRERPSFGAIAASLAALVGIAVMVGFGADGRVLGDLLASGMTVSMAVIMVLARRYQSIPFVPAAAISAVVSSLICLPFATPFEVSTGEMGGLALFGFVNSALGLGLFSLGARLLPAVETALIGSLDAPLSPLWVFIAFGDVPAASTIFGGGIVFVAVAVYLVASARAASAAMAPTIKRAT